MNLSCCCSNSKISILQLYLATDNYIEPPLHYNKIKFQIDLLRLSYL